MQFIQKYLIGILATYYLSTYYLVILTLTHLNTLALYFLPLQSYDVSRVEQGLVWLGSPPAGESGGI